MNNMPPITKNLIIINLLMFFATIVAERWGININYELGLHFFLSEKFNVTQLFTYMFLHGGIGHIFFNMFALWMFGRILENVWGPKRFLLFYIVCGIGAGIVQEVVQYIYINQDLAVIAQHYGGEVANQAKSQVYSSLAYTVGASGAIYGILLAFGMLFPNERLFIIPFPFPIKAKYFVVGYAAIELFTGLSNNPNDNVAHFAHLGGMLFGLILILYWKKKNNGSVY